MRRFWRSASPPGRPEVSLVALLEGRFHVTTEDIKAMAHPVLRHRLVTTFAAQSQKIDADAVVDMLIEKVPVELNQRAERLSRG